MTARRGTPRDQQRLRGGPAVGLVLFHGAGGSRDHPRFMALEAGLDLPVARVNFPYREKGPGRRPPDRMPRLVEAVADASAHWARAWGLEPDQLVLGGRSLGGRAASMAVAEGRAQARALLLLSYPLHPPGRPDRLRVEHWDRVTCPVLLVQGNRDPFGTPEEFGIHLPALAGPVTQSWLDGGHDPPRRHDRLIVATAAAWLAGSDPDPSGQAG